MVSCLLGIWMMHESGHSRVNAASDCGFFVYMYRTNTCLD